MMKNNIRKPLKYEILRCEICGDTDQTHLFASPLNARVICMKCAKEAK
jgi:formylmethanofuran dehydrogenase subunit E